MAVRAYEEFKRNQAAAPGEDDEEQNEHEDQDPEEIPELWRKPLCLQEKNQYTQHGAKSSASPRGLSQKELGKRKLKLEMAGLKLGKEKS
ncbi:hypothetical protein NDU88_003414 [Pleurodeles waltl]|uniref:Uncharacterized protein n=1 Tax=Pleurodeles waltl TaxID=8319 RepID=A0AAV7NLD7_PLEWA|nr:hypothetical protein NDU88_003414 [Pleurodeles waltl]